MIIQQRTWEVPQPRLTWAEAHERVRADNLVRTPTLMRDEDIDNAIRRAVEAAWPKCYEQQLWQSTLTSRTERITLPWTPDDIVLCAWQRTDTATPLSMPVSAAPLPSSFWTVEGDQWRFLAGDGFWPDGTLSFALRVISRPRSKGTNPGEEPTYCTVPIKYLLPLAKIELLPHLTQDAGGTFMDGLMAQEQQRRIVDDRLPRMVRPASAKHDGLRSVSTVIWYEWGQDSIRFSDLS